MRLATTDACMRAGLPELLRPRLGPDICARGEKDACTRSRGLLTKRSISPRYKLWRPMFAQVAGVWIVLELQPRFNARKTHVWHAYAIQEDPFRNFAFLQRSRLLRDLSCTV